MVSMPLPLVQHHALPVMLAPTHSLMKQKAHPAASHVHSEASTSTLTPSVTLVWVDCTSHQTAHPLPSAQPVLLGITTQTLAMKTNELLASTKHAQPVTLQKDLSLVIKVLHCSALDVWPENSPQRI